MSIHFVYSIYGWSDSYIGDFLVKLWLMRARLLFLLLCGLVLQTSLTAQETIVASTDTPQQTPNPPTAIMQARSFLDSGKNDRAIEVLQIFLKTSPNDGQANYLLGTAYYQKGKFDDAIAPLSKAVAQSTAARAWRLEAAQKLGLAHYFLGHIKEAIPFLEEVGRAPGDNNEVAFVLGMSYIQANRADNARATFARMFRVPPASASAYLINAQMMIRQRFEELAETELQKALALDPKLPQANFLLGELAIYHAQIDRGIELLQKEIAVNPAFGMAYYRLGEALTRQQKWSEAVAPLQKSIWLNPYFSGPYIVLGKVYLKKNEFGNAEESLRRATVMDPNNFSAHYLLAQVFQQMNKADEAKREFELAEKLRASASQ